MLDGKDLMNAVKKAAQEAVESSEPSGICFGKVTSKSPLKILVEQKMTLGTAQLVLTRNVTNFVTMVTVQWESETENQTHTHKVEGTDSGGDTIDLISKTESRKHTHEIKGIKQLTICNALQVGDEVVLVKQQGGQKYLVVDRVVSA